MEAVLNADRLLVWRNFNIRIPNAQHWIDLNVLLIGVKGFLQKIAQVLTIKCGVLENQVMAGERVESVLATLPGKDEVRAMLLAQLLAPAQKLVMQLQAPGQNLAFALDARKRQLEDGQK